MKTKRILLFMLLTAYIGCLYSQVSDSYLKLNNTHDMLSLSQWGPYSKKYAGISHINNINKGLRFDVSIFPGYYRNKILVPNVVMESGYFPWEISPDMSEITYRYELEWKDRVYIDVTYSILDSANVLTTMECVNNTEREHALQLNYIANIDYPENHPTKKINKENNACWVNCLNYTDINFTNKRITDNLVFDGWMRGEIRGKEYIDGYAIGKEFGKDKGDKVIYNLPQSIEKEGILGIYYRMKKGTKLSFQVDGIINKLIICEGTGNFEFLYLPYNLTNHKKRTLTFTSQGGSPIELNGLLFGSREQMKQLKIVPKERNMIPIETENINSLCLKFNDIDCHYGLAWDFSPYQVRRILNDELDIFFRKYVHEHLRTTIRGNENGFFSNIFLRPVELPSHSKKTIYGLICKGEKETVNETLKKFGQDKEKYISQKKKYKDPYSGIINEGRKYIFSQKMLQATLLSNVVYPVYTQREFIRHFSPGKWWNSLYTWDSGFIALGLAEIDLQKAIENLNAYTTPAESQSAFIHHGSLVPVQMYVYFELWNRTQSKDLLQYFYPRLKQYYDFFVGKNGSSSMCIPNSKLLKPWDYWSNSGGWDDYPAQVYVEEEKIGSKTSPVISTAHAIRIAKILRLAAKVLEKKEDIKEYDKAISHYSFMLQKHSWDGVSGYFSYIVHDSLGNPKNILLKKETGENFNMGLDGVYPLFSGICTNQQKCILIEKLFSDKYLWTQSGLGVVDQSASYYKHDGYWNGTVWMPHQWFMWKTMLDIGRSDLAWKIAKTALEVYNKETESSYYTFEHFIAKNGLGAGWHQFGGLSTPILIWFSAYFKPGTVTTGFESWIKHQSFNSDKTSYFGSITFDDATPKHARTILICLNPKFKYRAKINKKQINYIERHKGLLEIKLPVTNQNCIIEITPIVSTQ